MEPMLMSESKRAVRTIRQGEGCPGRNSDEEGGVPKPGTGFLQGQQDAEALQWESAGGLVEGW